jgi:hypothetical protein
MRSKKLFRYRRGPDGKVVAEEISRFEFELDRDLRDEPKIMDASGTLVEVLILFEIGAKEAEIISVTDREGKVTYDLWIDGDEVESMQPDLAQVLRAAEKRLGKGRVLRV